MGELFAGRFELVTPVAEGGMGSVWVVRDHRDGQLYAGKLLRQSDSGSLLRFMREQATRISHEHVVTPLSWAGEDDRVLFTMPLVRGGSVATLIGDVGPLPEPWVATLVDQVLQALEAVHGAGVVHRDVKPANLLLHPTGSGAPHLLLTDFGIAAHAADPRLTSASQVLGTPGYMAPEQLHGADPHPTQDIYAVGMVGLEMLTAQRPARSVDGDVVAPGATGPLADLLRRATALDPRERPGSAAEMRSLLAATEVRAPAEGTEAPHVFDHLAPPAPEAPAQHGTRVSTAPEHDPGAAPGRSPAGGRGPSAGRDRALGLLLILVAALCLGAAAWLLLA